MLTTPFLFTAGAIAMAIPIIIHLLNKRRFKRVDWAAMDFLLEAQKINKRKVKMEELILLLMRCLAVLLIGLLLARPFFSSKSSSTIFNTASNERVIVFDDSLSMRAAAGGTSALEQAKKTLGEWVSNLASNNSDDSLTLYLTSQPDKPVYNGVPLTEASVGEILEEAKRIEASDASGSLARTLGQIEVAMGEDAGSANRIVYVLSDMRQRDWSGSAEGGSDGQIVETLKRISEKAAGCYVMDLGADGEDNLVVEEVTTTDKALIAGVPSTFSVSVRNLGTTEANNVKVRFSVGESLPLEGKIDAVPAGGVGSSSFTYTFARVEEEGASPEAVAISAEVFTESGDIGDLLQEDNVRYFPGNVVDGIRVLLVDGDPSAIPGEGETFFLRKALAPRGSALSGVVVTVMEETEFEDAELADFQVIFLSNLYRLSEEQHGKLKSWVAAGGGLVVALGDQVDEEFYNTDFHAAGAGLLPVTLTGIEGDESEERWAYLKPDKASHPVFGIFEGEGNPLLEGVKVFQWWGMTVPEAALESGKTRVVASLTAENKEPIFVEGGYEDGRVAVFGTALDAGWNSWPLDPASYLITMQELVRYMARSNAREGDIAVAERIQHEIDLANYRADVEILMPDATPVPAQARPATAEDGATSTRWLVDFDQTAQRGVYQMNLLGAGGGANKSVLFAANLDPSESDLKRVDKGGLLTDLGDAAVQLVAAGQPLIELGASVTKSEFWKWVLYALLALLFLELWFGWWIGAKR